MSKYIIPSDMAMSMQVFLATDHYDHSTVPNLVSATSLLKPIRQLVLSSRIEPSGIPLEGLVASRLGTAIHDGIEKAWSGDYKATLKALGYTDKVIDKIVVNPKEVTEEQIPVYMEQRVNKEFNGYVISGKYDFVFSGSLEDFKSTSTYTYTNQTKDDDYVWQGSIYRWLNPEIITDELMSIQFIFTDWSSAKAKQDPNYPKSRIPRKQYQLKSIKETESFIKTKLDLMTKHKNSEETSLPLCTDEDLWRTEPVYKYYANPNKTARSTKNFDSKQDAYVFMAQAGKGIVLEKPGQVTACKYCSAFSLCSQKDALINAGDLVL